MLIYGEGIQRRQDGSGIMFVPITGEEAAPAPAGTRITLTLDGVEYPLLRAVVTRSRTAETAKATLPGAYMAGIIAAAPSALVITLSRVLADGSGTDTATLFTGTIDLTATTDQPGNRRPACRRGGILAGARQPAAAGRAKLRPGHGGSSSVRGQINPLTWCPGDVLRFSGVREIPVSKVVYSLSSDLQFMEASSGL